MVRRERWFVFQDKVGELHRPRKTDDVRGQQPDREDRQWYHGRGDTCIMFAGADQNSRCRWPVSNSASRLRSTVSMTVTDPPVATVGKLPKDGLPFVRQRALACAGRFENH